MSLRLTLAPSFSVARPLALASWGARGGLLVVPRRSAVTEALLAESAIGGRQPLYDHMWELLVEGADNIAYRLALTTLVRGQRVLELDAGRIETELRDDVAIRRLVAAVTDGDSVAAHVCARNLLERSIPNGA